MAQEIREKEWYYIDKSAKKGPFTTEEMKLLIDKKIVNSSTSVWCAGMDTWKSASDTDLSVFSKSTNMEPPPIPSNNKAFGRNEPRLRIYNNKLLGRVSFAAVSIAFIINLLHAFFIFASARLVRKGKSEQDALAMINFVEDSNLITAIDLLFFIFAVSFFFIWMYRSTHNLTILKGNQSVSPLGSVLWVFVPIMSFWKPLEAVTNLHTGFGVQKIGRSYIIYWWCLVWASVVLFIGLLMYAIANDLDVDHDLFAAFILLTPTYSAVAAIFYMTSIIIFQISQRELEMCNSTKL